MMLGAQKVSVLVLVCIARTGGPSSGGIDAGKASGSRTNGAPSGGHALTTGQHGGGGMETPLQIDYVALCCRARN
jgi:uncharacterized membrane protein